MHPLPRDPPPGPGGPITAPLRFDPPPPPMPVSLLASAVKPAFDPALMPDLRAPGAPIGGMIGGFAGPLPRHREAPYPPPFPADLKPGFPTPQAAWGGKPARFTVPTTTIGKAVLGGGLILTGLGSWYGFALVAEAAGSLLGAVLP